MRCQGISLQRNALTFQMLHTGEKKNPEVLSDSQSLKAASAAVLQKQCIINDHRWPSFYAVGTCLALECLLTSRILILNPCKIDVTRGGGWRRGAAPQIRTSFETVLVISLIKQFRWLIAITRSSWVTSSVIDFHYIYSSARCFCLQRITKRYRTWFKQDYRPQSKT